MRSRPTQIDDILAVLSKPSAVTEAEISASGRSPEDWAVTMVGALTDGDGITIETLERNPLAVFVHRERREGVRVVTAVSVPLYWELGAVAVFHTRRVVQKVFRQFPSDQFLCATRSRHPNARRWFRALGFKEVGTLIFEGGCNV